MHLIKESSSLDHRKISNEFIKLGDNIPVNIINLRILRLQNKFLFGSPQRISKESNLFWSLREFILMSSSFVHPTQSAFEVDLIVGCGSE